MREHFNVKFPHLGFFLSWLFLQDVVDGADNDDADDMPEIQETVAVVPGSTLLWRIDSRPPLSATVPEEQKRL